MSFFIQLTLESLPIALIFWFITYKVLSQPLKISKLSKNTHLGIVLLIALAMAGIRLFMNVPKDIDAIIYANIATLMAIILCLVLPHKNHA